MIRRRGLLGLLGCALAPLPPSDPVAAFGAVFVDTPASVGRRHLAAHADHASEAATAAHELIALARGRQQTLASLVGERIRADFAAGRIVLVDGWVLSLTEAQGCACRVLAG